MPCLTEMDVHVYLLEKRSGRSEIVRDYHGEEDWVRERLIEDYPHTLFRWIRAPQDVWVPDSPLPAREQRIFHFWMETVDVPPSATKPVVSSPRPCHVPWQVWGLAGLLAAFSYLTDWRPPHLLFFTP